MPRFETKKPSQRKEQRNVDIIPHFQYPLPAMESDASIHTRITIMFRGMDETNFAFVIFPRQTFFHSFYDTTLVKRTEQNKSLTLLRNNNY